jgi:galactose mutarotase-like enzyme
MTWNVRTYTDRYEIYELAEAETDSAVRVCPERGGIAIGCRLHGRELLYLDRGTFLDPSANIRGGIPVLFPICGQLEGGEYEWEGVRYAMKNHGVARISPWEVAGTGTDGEASLTLVLRSGEATMASYPFAFELQFTYALSGGALAIRQSYRNLSDRSMPVQAGFHPYFATAAKKLRYDTDATRYLDYNDGREKPFDGAIDLSGLVESVALLDPRTPRIAFELDGIGRVEMRYSKVFGKVVLWSVEGKPFVCVEPWTALNGALNRKEGLIPVAPGDALEAELTIRLDPAAK